MKLNQLENDESMTYDEAQLFTMMGTELLERGQSQTLIALAPQLWLHSKVYASGGERVLHAHPQEDHAFFIVGGKGRFENDKGEVTEVGPMEGIMFPRGVRYQFESIGDAPLVILRIGAGANNERREFGRMAASRPTILGDSPEHNVVMSGDGFSGS